jgi:hypothetical protein
MVVARKLAVATAADDRLGLGEGVGVWIDVGPQLPGQAVAEAGRERLVGRGEGVGGGQGVHVDQQRGCGGEEDLCSGFHGCLSIKWVRQAERPRAAKGCGPHDEEEFLRLALQPRDFLG